MLSVTRRLQLLEQVQGVLGTYNLELVLVRKLRCNLEDGTQCWRRISKMKWGGKALGKCSSDVQCLWVEQRLAHTLHQARLMGHAKNLSELPLEAMHPGRVLEWDLMRLDWCFEAIASIGNKERSM